MSHLTLVAPSSQSTLRPALAHDIRNAMAVIGLNIEMLERHTAKLEDQASSRLPPHGFGQLERCIPHRFQLGS